MEMKKLVGTEKQIWYAEKIRKETIEERTEQIERNKKLIEEKKKEENPNDFALKSLARTERRLKEFEKELENILELESAKDIIEGKWIVK